MKGNRAKKAAEEAARAEAEANGLAPSPPDKPRDGPPRPGPVTGNGSVVQIPEEEFKRLCAEMRANKLIGPAAADAFESAAGLAPPGSPQGKKAGEMREKVAENREDEAEKPKKKKMGGFAQAEEIPDEPIHEAPKPKGRASISEAVDANDLEAAQNHCEKDAPEPPELNLNPKQNQLRTDIEMWVMDEIPALFGVDDSEELDESLQEDAQANQVTFLIAASEQAEQEKIAKGWLSTAPDADALEAFTKTLLEKIQAVQAAGAKKKKKKKKAE